MSTLTYKCYELLTACAWHIWISFLTCTHKLTENWLGCETALCGFHQSTSRYLPCSKTMQLFRSDLWKSVSQVIVNSKLNQVAQSYNQSSFKYLWGQIPQPLRQPLAVFTKFLDDIFSSQNFWVCNQMHKLLSNFYLKIVLHCFLYSHQSDTGKEQLDPALAFFFLQG